MGGWRIQFSNSSIQNIYVSALALLVRPKFKLVGVGFMIVNDEEQNSSGQILSTFSRCFFLRVTHTQTQSKRERSPAELRRREPMARRKLQLLLGPS